MESPRKRLQITDAFPLPCFWSWHKCEGIRVEKSLQLNQISSCGVSHWSPSANCPIKNHRLTDTMMEEMPSITTWMWAKHRRHDDWNHVPFILPTWNFLHVPVLKTILFTALCNSVSPILRVSVSSAYLLSQISLKHLSKKVKGFSHLNFLIFYFSEILWDFKSHYICETCCNQIPMSKHNTCRFQV